MVEPNWDVLREQLKQAFDELDIDDPATFRRNIIEQLWRLQCPECVPHDGHGATNYYVIRALVKDIDAGRDRACGCHPYAVTMDVFQAFCDLYAQLPPFPGRAPCGYGWTLRGDTGAVIVVGGVGGGHEQVPIEADQGGTPVLVEEAPPAPSTFSVGRFAAVLGFVGAAAFAFTRMNDKLVRPSPRLNPAPSGRMTRAELDRELAARAGCVALRYTRSGRLVGLYRSAESGIEVDPETPWATVCEEHGGVVCHETRVLAESNLSVPETWCPDCQGDASSIRPD